MKISKKVPTKPEQDEERDSLREAEQRMNALLEALANAENRLESLKSEADQLVAEKVNGFVSRFMENAQRKFDIVEMRVVGRILDFFKQCPYWETIRVDYEEVNRNGAASIFSAHLKKKHRYIGDFFDETTKSRYMLFIKPQESPVTESEYLRIFEKLTTPEALTKISAKQKAEKPSAAPAPKKKLKVGKK